MRLVATKLVMLVRSTLGAKMVVTLLASSALAFDPADLKKLKETTECVECHLTFRFKFLSKRNIGIHSVTH